MPPKKNNTGSPTPSSTREDTQPIIMSNEQFTQLIAQITRQSLSADVSASSVNINRISEPRSFAKCTARFDGNDNSDVDSFIDSVETYKDCTGITEENAVRGLSLLLTGVAATWWRGIKQSTDSWSSAITSLREAFSKKLPPPLVYREIFAYEQTNEATDLFVCRIRELFAQLPYPLPSEAQIDIVYGLLSRKLRKHITRAECSDFKTLLERAREVERLVTETKNDSNKSSEMKVKREKERVFCKFCKKLNHDVTNCYKLQKKSEVSKSKVDTEARSPSVPSSKPTIKCYGCGAPGVIRQNCNTCMPKKDDHQSIKYAEFHRIETDIENQPKFHVEIEGFRGTAHPDTCATHSVASTSLFNLIKDRCPTETKEVDITLADGTRSTQQVKNIAVNVTLEGRTHKVNLMVLPGDTDNRTLLGYDFLKMAKISIDIGTEQWFYDDAPKVRYSLREEMQSAFRSFKAEEKEEIPEVKKEDITEENENWYLREDEGVDLDVNQRQSLNDLLVANAMTFEPGGEPTPYAEHAILVREGQIPIASPPYRMPTQKQEIMKKEIERILAEDVIEECESPWAAPAILVPKKDGSCRLCID